MTEGAFILGFADAFYGSGSRPDMDRGLPWGALVGKPTKARISKQMSGYLMLYAAVQIRAAQGPEARWYECYDKESKTYINTVALLGPVAPYMLAADLLCRANLQGEEGKYGMFGELKLIAGSEEYRKNRHENWARMAKDPLVISMFGDGMFREYQKALFGTTFRTGIGLDMVQELEDDMRYAMNEPVEETFLAPGFNKAFARFMANYTNTFMVSMGEVRDVFSTINPDYELIHDTNSLTNSFDLYVAKSLRSWPISLEGKYLGLFQGPEGVELLATDATQREALRREGRDVTQVTGFGATERERIVDRELIRLDIPKFKAYPSFRKMPSLNRKANALYAEYTNKVIRPYLESAEYQNMPNTQESALEQRVMLEKLFLSMRTTVNDALAEMAASEYNRSDLTEKKQNTIESELLFLYKMKYDRFPDSKQRLAENMFKRQHGGRGPAASGQNALRDLTVLINLVRKL